MKPGFRNSRTLQLISAMGVFILSGCGGGGNPGEDIGNAIGQGLVCGVLNCKESSDLALTDISTRFSVSQNNGVVQVDAGLGQSANVFTTVRPSGNDRITASGNGQSIVLSDNSGGMRTKYSGQFNDNSAQPVVTVSLQRGADNYPATVTIPSAFSITTPAAVSNLPRSAVKMRVQFSRAMPGYVYASMSVNCNRTDGSSFTDSTDINHKLDPDAYRIDTLDLDAVLNARSQAKNNNNPNTALVSTCTIDFTWTNYVTGTVSSSLNKYSEIRGLRSVTHRVNYDSRA
ncbi:hypothetical protein [Undibacterium squillarum]|uniref:Lipoprotein n=1 Tax=Undibacterium squillarum TaxID=1131567 RepID=A0ABQ2XZ88_9BURK|nr:hypothetical protein [Undibacterium squillarum]GGX39697.1 hypothetical protein GCM10010946_17830 [Undibacterium squillarum]